MSDSAPFLRSLLERDNLKWNWDETAAECVAKPALVPALIGFCVDADLRVQQNAGAVVGKIVDLDEALLMPHLPAMLNNLDALPHDAVKRATMRVLHLIDIPEDIEGKAFDLAMRYLVDFDEPIAVRAHSVTIARCMCQRYPSLRHELIPALREVMQHSPPAAISSRARKDMKLLEALAD